VTPTLSSGSFAATPTATASIPSVRAASAAMKMIPTAQAPALPCENDGCEFSIRTTGLVCPSCRRAQGEIKTQTHHVIGFLCRECGYRTTASVKSAASSPTSLTSSVHPCDASTRGHTYRSDSIQPPHRRSTRATFARALDTPGTDGEASGDRSYSTRSLAASTSALVAATA